MPTTNFPSSSRSATASRGAAWAPGGMKLFCDGYVLQLLPLGWLAVTTAASAPRVIQAVWAAVLVASVAGAFRASPKAYFWLTVPMFSCALPLCFLLPRPMTLAVTALIVMQLKIGVCMSVCLHRFAAHAGFRCGPITRTLLGCLGCFANQGGPIWWASKHRCHHKYCDGPRDPHSVALMGEIPGFAFFTRQQSVDEEFAPAHLEGIVMRIVDSKFDVGITCVDQVGGYTRYLFGKDAFQQE